MHKLVAFLVRGYRIEASYPLSFVSELVSSLVPVVVFYFASKLIDTSGAPALARYGGKYFPFTLAGVALTQFYGRALRMGAESLRRAQLSGVLEAILSTPTRPAAFVLYDASFGVLVAFANLLVVLVLGGLALSVDFVRVNLFGVGAAVFLGLLALMSLGIISAALTILFKKGEPVQFLFGGAAAILSGAYFPVSLFPKPVRMLANLLPTTHALEAARLALFTGAGVEELAEPLGILLLMCGALFPVSLWCFELAVSSARRNGTLLQY